MSRPISDIAGIPDNAMRVLEKNNISTVEGFISFFSSNERLQALSVESKVPLSTVESWYKQADLVVNSGVEPAISAKLIERGLDRTTITSRANTDKIAVVKEIRDLTGLNLSASSELIKEVSKPQKVDVVEGRYEYKPTVDLSNVVEMNEKTPIDQPFIRNPPLAEVMKWKRKRYFTRFRDPTETVNENKPIEGVQFEVREPLDTIQTEDGKEVNITTLSDADLELMLIKLEIKLLRHNNASENVLTPIKTLQYALKAEQEHRDDQEYRDRFVDELFSVVRRGINEYNLDISSPATANNTEETRRYTIERIRGALRELAYRGYQVKAKSDEDDDSSNDLSPWLGSAGTEFFDAMEEALKNVTIADEYVLSRIEGVFQYERAGTDWPLRNAGVVFMWKGSFSKSNISMTGETGDFFDTTPKNLVVSEVTMIITKAGVSQSITFSAQNLRKMKGNLGIVKLKKEFSQTEGLLETLDNLTEDMNAIADKELEREEQQEPPKVTFGDGENEFVLEADTTPSKFTYKILHRLIEPDMVKIVNGKRESVGRQTLNNPLDIPSFVEIMSTDPNAQPMMASLGIGYILSMQQEWRPTKFSLGDMLYSVALAPGEEQRIIMTERSENYQVADMESLSDLESESFLSSQSNSVNSVFVSSMLETLYGKTHMESKTKSAGTGLIASLFAASNKLTTTAFSESEQNSHRDETSAMSERLHETVARRANKQRVSNRTGIRSATSNESSAVISKIIANHNHSHALTMQYWEVVRDYTISSRINDVNLVCYVPFKPIPFLPKNQKRILDFRSNMSGSTVSNDAQRIDEVHVRTLFNERYIQVLKYYDSIHPRIPSKYRNGLLLLKKYATYPEWDFAGSACNKPMLFRLNVSGGFLSIHKVSARVILKNGKSIVAHPLKRVKEEVHDCQTKSALIEHLIGEKDRDVPLSFEFMTPSEILDDDIRSFEISFTYPSSANFKLKLSEWEESILSDLNIARADHEGILKWITGRNEIELNTSDLRKIGYPTVRSSSLWKITDREELLSYDFNVKEMNPRITYPLYDRMPTMTYKELQSIEDTFQHILENTIRYSQGVWANLSSGERALMLERFTIALPAAKGTDVGAKVPLMDCVSNQIEGFYGNCMIMPFAYPPEMADALNTSTKKLQDAIYRYHIETFRSPETTVSLGTNGMIGEAVLGGSNASEKIDITRFWNWMDSPIVSATDIGVDDLDTTSLLKGRSAPNGLVGLESDMSLAKLENTAMPDMLKYLAKEKRATANLTNAENVAKHMTAVAEANVKERINTINASASLANEAIGAIAGVKPTEEVEKAKATKEKAEESDRAKKEAEIAKAKAEKAASELAETKAKKDKEKLERGEAVETPEPTTDKTKPKKGGNEEPSAPAAEGEVNEGDPSKPPAEEDKP